jgi:hypothetical protein
VLRSCLWMSGDSSSALEKVGYRTGLPCTVAQSLNLGQASASAPSCWAHVATCARIPPQRSGSASPFSPPFLDRSSFGAAVLERRARAKRTGSDHHVGRPRGRASSPRRSSASRSREHPSSIHERKQHARARPWIHAWSRWRATCECRIAPARCSRAPQAPGLTIPLVAVCRAWFFAPSLFWRLCLVSAFAGRRSRPRR